MCYGAILLYGIPRVVIGENDTFVGEEDLLRSRGVQVLVLVDARCRRKLMSDFIKEQRTRLIPWSWPGIVLISWSGRLSKVVVQRHRQANGRSTITLRGFHFISFRHRDSMM
ncbi:hypothetical protein BC827DRAFT_332508 [Russula dissimulans]|nr:hypothetical protein BC827DRAFT_332508 [Russula dissimulans]